MNKRVGRYRASIAAHGRVTVEQDFDKSSVRASAARAKKFIASLLFYDLDSPREIL